MSEESSSVDRKGDHWVDAIATVVLVGVFVSALVYWLMSQS